MAYSKNTYSEIAKLPITDKRNIVVSKCSSGGYSIAQQSPIQEGDKTTWIYFKGAIHVKDLEHLYNARDCINMAIQLIEEQIEDDKSWDDITPAD